MQNAKILRCIDSVISNINRFIFTILIKINRTNNSNSIFASLWDLVNRHHALFNLRKYTSTYNFPQDWKNHVYIDLLTTIRKSYPDYSPEVVIRNENVIRNEIKQGVPAVFIGIHTELIASFYVFFERNHIKWAVFSANRDGNRYQPKISRKANLFGVITPLTFVPNSGKSFLLARQLIRDNMVICCAPDYRPKVMNGTANQIYISPGIFEFCMRLNALMIYTNPTVLENATIDLNLSCPGRAGEFVSVDDIIIDFTKYVETVTKVPGNWIVQKRGKSHL